MEKFVRKSKKLSLATSLPILLAEEKSHPKLLKDCNFPFMKNKPKFKAQAIWDRVKKEEFTDISVCSGIINLINVGVVIPAWCDYIIKIGPDGTYEWVSPLPEFFIESHGGDGTGQFNGFKKGYLNIKFMNPWRNASKEPISFLLMQPWLHEETRFEVAEAIGISKYGTEININVFFKIPKKEETIYIKEGEPLAYLIPYDARINKIELECKDLGIFAGRNSFINWTKFLLR